MACTAGAKYCIFQGDNLPITLTVTDSAGDPIDITDWTILFSVSNDFEKEADIIDGPNGTALLSLEAAETELWETGTFSYQFNLSDSDSTPSRTFQGVIEVKETLRSFS